MKKKRRSRAKVQRLRFFGPDSKPYERHPKTEDNIAELLPLPHAERAAKAPFALNETLVYLIRRADSKSAPYYDVWCDEISKRLVGLADYYTRELPEPTASDIVMKVQSDFERSLFAERVSARTDFLEVAFALAVKKRTLQLVNLYVSSPWTQQSKAAADDEETKRELQGIPDKGPGPEGALLDKEEQALGKEMCKTALGAIQNPLLRGTARLYWMLLHGDDDGGTRSSSCEGNLDDRCRLSGRFRMNISSRRFTLKPFPMTSTIGRYLIRIVESLRMVESSNWVLTAAQIALYVFCVGANARSAPLFIGLAAVFSMLQFRDLYMHHAFGAVEEGSLHRHYLSQIDLAALEVIRG